MKNELYWAYNVPLQVSPAGDGYPSSVLNYMPRKERCEWLELDEVLGEQSREEFFESAALHLENLARLMRLAKTDETMLVYYADTGMEPTP